GSRSPVKRNLHNGTGILIVPFRKGLRGVFRMLGERRPSQEEETGKTQQWFHVNGPSALPDHMGGGPFKRSCRSNRRRTTRHHRKAARAPGTGAGLRGWEDR